MFEGDRKRMHLGRYPSMSLAEAREVHGKALADVERGVDPGAVAREAKRARKAAPTFGELLDELWDIELRHKKSGAETRRLMDHDVTPAWGKRRVQDITRRDVVLLLDSIRARAPITANRVHGALGRAFNFAAERGIIVDSPCTRIRKPVEKPRERVLTDDEIRAFWRGLDSIDVYPATRLALRLILVTGQRPGEVAGMRWAEVADDWWTVPPERMKNGLEHGVPLVATALDLLEQARDFPGGDEYVFASSRGGGKKPITVRSLARSVTRHCEEMGIASRFTPHDLRRTLRTRLAELGVDDVVAEKVLGHQLQGILKVYNRHDYAAEKRAALLAWERRLRGILGLEGGKRKVVPLAGFKG
ncbi:tyrosine-type recombinase/integrase [Desulfolutivibrio sulfoxidireducens]|uniref:tyrosine-type recombinase/integrase n=1 Tax=Desulfolutivibrio sulfoxidireducens TaxID=2773299 RepID=UPI003F6388D1